MNGSFVHLRSLRSSLRGRAVRPPMDRFILSGGVLAGVEGSRSKSVNAGFNEHSSTLPASSFDSGEYASAALKIPPAEPGAEGSVFYPSRVWRSFVNTQENVRRFKVSRVGSIYPPQRRGAIFIIALAVIIVLSGLVLVFAQEMRTE